MSRKERKPAAEPQANGGLSLKSSVSQASLLPRNARRKVFMINIPKGTKDVLPSEAYKWHFVENTARRIAALYNLHEIRTPVFEHTELFLRGVGDTTDIVNKEMDQAMAGNTLSITDGAVLAAMNVADKYCKERQVSDNLRAQLKQALDENARLARELAEAKREARKAARGEKGTKAPKQGPRQEET